jgi:hypothetical protein
MDDMDESSLRSSGLRCVSFSSRSAMLCFMRNVLSPLAGKALARLLVRVIVAELVVDFVHRLGVTILSRLETFSSRSAALKRKKTKTVVESHTNAKDST